MSSHAAATPAAPAAPGRPYALVAAALGAGVALGAAACRLLLSREGTRPALPLPAEVEVVSPYHDGRHVLTRLPADSEASVRAKYERCVASQRQWARTSMAHRRGVVEAFKALLEENLEALAAEVTRETGRPISVSREVLAAVPARVQYFLDSFERVQAEERPDRPCSVPGVEARVRWEPLGVLAHISAWNYPVFMGVDFLVPCVLTGNGCLYKPSELSPSSALLVCELLVRAGLPDDLVAPLVGGGGVGQAMLRMPGLAGVSFIGSDATAARVAAAAAPGVPLDIEAGGKDATAVLDDASLDAAVQMLASGAFENSGASCNAVERILVADALYDRFVEQLAARVSAMRVGPPDDPATEVGPMTRGAAQVCLLEEQVADAVALGARVVVGGARKRGLPGHYFQPTVLADCTHAMRVFREESFGPVIGVERLPAGATDGEVVALVNKSRYGLTGGVFTGSAERAMRFLRDVEAGTVYWNGCSLNEAHLPWSGRKASGVGYSLGDSGVRRSFLRPKTYFLAPQRW